ncbi:hypothetical protein HPB51_000410 [Rhipicephalus microplus]|uniref:Uncharacterized protein n=1 Tax=Rhipicephalus microplus TaxID=6941 RepID=A0A9J6E537_RHIMP|nr:hypothetical protein HPB51_000410 [Rhipicephalus microplus]
MLPRRRGRSSPVFLVQSRCLDRGEVVVVVMVVLQAGRSPGHCSADYEYYYGTDCQYIYDAAQDQDYVAGYQPGVAHRFHTRRNTGIPEYSASYATRDYHRGYSGYGASCTKWHHHTYDTEYDDSGATCDYYKCESTYTGTQTTPDDYTCDSDNNDVHSTCNYNTYGRENNEFLSTCCYYMCDFQYTTFYDTI